MQTSIAFSKSYQEEISWILKRCDNLAPDQIFILNLLHIQTALLGNMIVNVDVIQMQIHILPVFGDFNIFISYIITNKTTTHGIAFVEHVQSEGKGKVHFVLWIKQKTKNMRVVPYWELIIVWVWYSALHWYTVIP